MAGGFASPVVNAAGTLIRTVLKSINYIAATAGWAIFKNGNVDFAAGTFRGTITITSLDGSKITIDAGSVYPNITWRNAANTNDAGISALNGPTFVDLLSTSGKYTPADTIQRRSRVYHDGQNDLLAVYVMKEANQSPDGGYMALTSASGFYGFRDFDAADTYQYILTSAAPQISATHSMNIVGETWHGFPYAPFWSDFGGGNMPGRYRKVVAPAFSIQLVGVITIASGGGVNVCTLPVGYRPNQRVRFFAQSSVSANGRFFDLMTSGAINSVSGALTAGEIFEFNVLIPCDVV